ncbi:MAG: hypothetical protein OXH84_02675 [Gammaproteobacteria bacterium]|nr:hypothetical protein [Gammaproteobacteria bacterium]
MGELQKNLDQLATRGSRYLRRFAFKEAMEKAWASVGWIALILPAVYVIVQIYELVTATTVWPLGIFLTIVCTILIPVVFLALWALIGFLFGHIDRQTSLALFDRELRLKDRLQAADEFIRKDQATPFESAAISDAIPHAQEAMQTRLGKIEIARPAMDAVKWQHVIGALVLLAIGVTAHALVFEPEQPEEDQTQDEILLLPDHEDAQLPSYGEEERGAREAMELDTPVPEEQKKTKVRKGEESLSSDSNLTEAQEATSTPREAMQTGLSGTASQQNQPGQANSSVSGQGDPENKEDQEARAKDPSKKKDSKQKEPKESDKDESASGIAGGKGTGSGQQSSSSEMLEQNFRSKTDDFDDDVDQESDDEEDEEQESASAAKPMLNQKKAPVDRRLAPSGVSNEENEQANGRGGAGGLKKTRGVAAMLLGVPMPDKLRSQVNIGRIKVQRERAVPVPNQVTNIESEDRGEIDESVGEFSRPEMKPWLSDVVKNYFTSLRQESSP